uniref:Uncharacterized protein n=1 Tax=Ditylum brightwellii TaxID=49249 RepID=A0A7S4R0H6_9STRA
MYSFGDEASHFFLNTFILHPSQTCLTQQNRIDDTTHIALEYNSLFFFLNRMIHLGSALRKMVQPRGGRSVVQHIKFILCVSKPRTKCSFFVPHDHKAFVKLPPGTGIAMYPICSGVADNECNKPSI